jgi:hypothetical protein
VWFWASLGLTAAFVAGTVASGVDTKNKHDTFVETGELRIAGHSAQVRTNVLFGFTSALALATAGLGIFAVDWGDDEAPETARLFAGPAGLSLSVVGDF